MSTLPIYDLLFYGGIALIAIAALFIIIFLIVHFCRGVKLNRILDEEYGDPAHYNRRKKGRP